MKLVNKMFVIQSPRASQNKGIYLLCLALGIILISFNFYAQSSYEDQTNAIDDFNFVKNQDESSEFAPPATTAEKPQLDIVKSKASLRREKRVWNLDNVDILALIGEISQVTGRNFVIDPRVTGKASLVSNEPMDAKQAYKAFLSILQVLGFSAIESGAVTKIVPDAAAKQLDTKVNTSNLGAIGDEMVVQVIPVKHVSATALMPILRNLVNTQGHVAPYAPSNVIVIADHASNVKRIIEIIHRIDTESSDDLEIITLKDASSDEVVKVLNNLMARSQALGDPAMQQVKMAADPRTNSIVLSGDKVKRLKIRALIAQMDVPAPKSGNTEVIYLQYQTANDLVPVLSSIIDAYYGKTASGSSSSYNSNMHGSSLSAGGPDRAGSYSSNSSTSSSGVTSNFQLPEARRGQEGGASAQGVRAEPNTNSLVVTAPPELMRNIKAVIARLDIRRPQILVEALIVEVTMNHTEDLGIEWRLPNHSNSTGGGTSYPGAIISDSGLISSLTGTTTGTGTSATTTNTQNLLARLPLAGLSVGFLRHGDIRAILNALEKDTNTNVISTPSLVAMDNETAEIVVAEKIPFQTAQRTPDATGATINSFDYKDVGLSLKLTPMITKGDAVKLTIEQHTDNIRSSGLTPTTATRSIKTSVVVNDKDVLVLGGLIQGQMDNAQSKVPILGDIPIIGHLFKRDAGALTKRNLMVFIRPVVIRNTEESNNISFGKYDLMRDDQLLYKLDPYAKIAKQLMPELPDIDKTHNILKADRKKLELPEPF